MSELNVGMGMSVGDHKFKNAMTGSLRNLWELNLVLLDIRWQAPRPDKGGFESRTWLYSIFIGKYWTWLYSISIGKYRTWFYSISIGERLNLIREDFMGMGIIQERDGGQLKELTIISQCGAARHGLGIHTLNN